MLTLFRLLSRWPLWLLHLLGAALGWMVFALSPTYRRRFVANAAQAGYSFAQVRAAVAHAGRMSAELPRLWMGAPTPLQWEGSECVDAAYARGQGVIFLTPHLGCYEITALYYAARHPITVLYRPARQQWLAPLTEEGRNRSQIKQVPTNMGGVRSLLKALKKQEAIGILPDQVPEFGEGVWADFFGTPAYTMTLVGKLAETANARILLAFGERLSWGRGYVIHIHPLELEPTPGNINQGIEQLVRQCPQQYLWSYRRYKRPKPHGRPREDEKQ